jgi:uncharacterized protein YndB with AHSA1/START domain
MQTIDQRIIIPASPEAVWGTLCDVRQNPTWMHDCEAIAFVSSSHSGPGTRWRSTVRKGHDALIQVTAWYNGLGYEYTIVDGMPFRQNIGRIRLQEIPEGTVVQWTFSYEPRGMFRGGRQLENSITESLRALYKLLQNARDKRPLEPKSVMRDDPGVEARSSYKPRHPSALDKDSTPKPDTQPNRPSFPSLESNATLSPAVVIDEPPIQQDDTRPRPAAPLAVDAPAARREPLPPPVPFDEPDFLSDVQPIRAVPAHDAMFMPPARQPMIVEPPPTIEDTKPVPVRAAEPHAPQAVEASTAPLDAAAPVAETLDSIARSRAEAEPVAPVVTLPQLESDDEVGEDTASIWEVFNLPRPSESQEMRAIQAQREALAYTATTETASVHPPRMGLRAYQRRRIVNIQRPSAE